VWEAGDAPLTAAFDVVQPGCASIHLAASVVVMWHFLQLVAGPEMLGTPIYIMFEGPRLPIHGGIALSSSGPVSGWVGLSVAGAIVLACTVTEGSYLLLQSIHKLVGVMDR